MYYFTGRRRRVLIGCDFQFGIGYVVQAYLQMPTERWACWHTLRAFRRQGDAHLFRDILMQQRTIDPAKYARSYDNKRIVTDLHYRDGKLTLNTTQRIKL